MTDPYGNYQKAAKSIDHPYFENAKDWLKATTCESLFPEKRTEIVTVEKGNTIATAFKVCETKTQDFFFTYQKGLSRFFFQFF